MLVLSAGKAFGSCSVSNSDCLNKIADEYIEDFRESKGLDILIINCLHNGKCNRFRNYIQNGFHSKTDHESFYEVINNFIPVMKASKKDMDRAQTENLSLTLENSELKKSQERLLNLLKRKDKAHKKKYEKLLKALENKKVEKIEVIKEVFVEPKVQKVKKSFAADFEDIYRKHRDLVWSIIGIFSLFFVFIIYRDRKLTRLLKDIERGFVSLN